MTTSSRSKSSTTDCFESGTDWPSMRRFFAMTNTETPPMSSPTPMLPIASNVTLPAPPQERRHRGEGVRGRAHRVGGAHFGPRCWVCLPSKGHALTGQGAEADAEGGDANAPDSDHVLQKDPHVYRVGTVGNVRPHAHAALLRLSLQLPPRHKSRVPGTHAPG